MTDADRQTVAKLLLDEMRERLERATPATQERENQIIIMCSNIIVTLQPELSSEML